MVCTWGQGENHVAQLKVLADRSSWNRELEHARATALGAEFKAKGVNVLLGPVVGPLGRIALGGRNWEGFSNDPYLSGALVHETVTGAQSSGVITSTKACYSSHILEWS